MAAHLPRSVAKRLAQQGQLADQYSALTAACRAGRLGQVRSFARCPEARHVKLSEIRDVHELSLLHLACAGRHVSIAKLLVCELSHPVDLRDCFGRTPLVLAIYRADCALVTLLLDAGASCLVRGAVESAGRWSLGDGGAAIACARLLGAALARHCLRQSVLDARWFGAVPAHVRALVRTLLLCARACRGAGSAARGALASLAAPLLCYVLARVAACALCDLAALGPAIGASTMMRPAIVQRLASSLSEGAEDRAMRGS